MTSATAFELRSAAPSDAEEITRLFLASRAAAMPYLPRIHSDEDTLAWITHVVLPDSRVWVAVSSTTQEILGFAALEDGMLEHLYLLPEARRNGIGTRLLEEVRAAAPEGLSLNVFQRNEDAIAFYVRHGFQLVETNDGSRNEENEPDATYRWTPAV
ncbi:GNAT family N-acetyltransferase [Streptomyces sp. NPDC058646]|uniref:GNAT family N-acetyltransferase n=1 Tax=Streptomyces sp. NPDC058646 TaxID=3346574 RepID=UPI003667459D